MQQLGEIPVGVAITDKDGVITLFFRLLWQQLIDGFVKTPTAATVERTNQGAVIATTSAYLVRAAGLYRVSYYTRKTVADGVSSSLTVTLGWTDHAVPLTEAGAALATDTVSTQQSGSKLIYADANSDITFAVAYASNTPGAMRYQIEVSVEQLAS